MQTILDVSHVTKTFHERNGKSFKALDDISLNVLEGECIGIVGESGSGKSTLAKIITRLIPPDSGSVSLCGTEMTTAKGKDLRKVYRNMKMIFQEPRSSFDPRLTLGESINDALKPVFRQKNERRQEAERLLHTVGLSEKFLDMYPVQVSGGECQRAAIARAIGQKPKLLICDEATSALDVSVQAQVMEVLDDIRKKNNISFLFISHDLSLVSSFCNKTYVLYCGKIVEAGKTEQIIHDPVQDYTKKLISSVLTV